MLAQMAESVLLAVTAATVPTVPKTELASACTMAATVAEAAEVAEYWSIRNPAVTPIQERYRQTQVQEVRRA